jgi:hypothetical protein
MIESYRLKGITSGWVFRKEIRAPGRQSNYEPYFFNMVQSIHASGAVAVRLLDPEDDIPSLYGLGPSLRLRYVTHAIDMGITDADQKRLARLRYVE